MLFRSCCLLFGNHTNIFNSLNKNFICIQRKRDEVKSGISFQNSVHNDDRIQSYSKAISDYLDLYYCFGYQFKYDLNGIPKILECNPRVQGTMIFSTFMGANIIYSSIKSVLGENIPELSYDFDTKLLRYWGALGINKNGIIKICFPNI
jgi:carbamoyl-phosphate synthase large subunit